MAANTKYCFPKLFETQKTYLQLPKNVIPKYKQRSLIFNSEKAQNYWRVSKNRMFISPNSVNS